MGLQDRLDSVAWMETETKRVAVEKVKRIVDKVGYPSWMTDDNYIDKKYSIVSTT